LRLMDLLMDLLKRKVIRRPMDLLKVIRRPMDLLKGTQRLTVKSKD
jgi:hypothetical protein